MLYSLGTRGLTPRPDPPGSALCRYGSLKPALERSRAPGPFENLDGKGYWLRTVPVPNGDVMTLLRASAEIAAGEAARKKG